MNALPAETSPLQLLREPLRGRAFRSNPSRLRSLTLAARSACRKPRPPPPTVRRLVPGLLSGPPTRPPPISVPPPLRPPPPPPRPIAAATPHRRGRRPRWPDRSCTGPVAMVTAERFLFSHPTHLGCQPSHSRDSVRKAASGSDESGRINILSCRKRQRPSWSLSQLIDITTVNDRRGPLRSLSATQMRPRQTCAPQWEGAFWSLFCSRQICGFSADLVEE